MAQQQKMESPVLKNEDACCVLFIEDDADDRFLGKQEMESSPLVREVKCFASAAEFTRYLRDQGFYDHTVTCQTPTVIVLDLNMPNFSGLKLLESLKTDLFLGNIPMILVSSELSYETMHAAQGLCADGIFRKPVKMEKLAPYLRNGWRWPTPEMWMT